MTTMNRGDDGANPPRADGGTDEPRTDGGTATGSPDADELFTGIDLGWEHLKNRVFLGVIFTAAMFGVVVLAVLLLDVVTDFTSASRSSISASYSF